MKCYLHIGTEKTATTTIQEFLHVNRSKLLKHHYFFTKSAGYRNNAGLALAAYNQHRRDNLTNSRALYNDRSFRNYQKRIVKNLKKELANHQDCTVVFSSEHIQSRLSTITELKRLKQILLELGCDDIRVVVYLRNPVDLASSLYSTFVVVGDSGAPPSPRDSYFSHVCNHRNTLEKFGEVFGESRLIPRLFAKEAFVQGSILSDFAEAIGLSCQEQFRFPPSRNERLSARGIEILRSVNQIFPVFIGKRRVPLRSKFGWLIARVIGGTKYKIPEELALEYEQAFHESNEWVRKHYFPERASLFSASLALAESEQRSVCENALS